MNFKHQYIRKNILGHFEIDLSEIVLMVISLAALWGVGTHRFLHQLPSHVESRSQGWRGGCWSLGLVGSQVELPGVFRSFQRS